MKVLVIGDSCIDTFVYCNIDRICPEAPVPVLQPVNTYHNPGMASNVAANLESLGVEVDMITNSDLIEKIRYVDNKSGQMIMRLDKNDICESADDISIEIGKYDAIVISDYCKGFLSEEMIKAICKDTECPTFLDTKKKLGDWCKGVDFIKINKPEWEYNLDYKGDNVIITMGSDGAEHKGEIFETEKVKVSDVSGAGDTFMAALVYKYVYGIIIMKQRDIRLAIDFANKCASKVVQERGVSVL